MTMTNNTIPNVPRYRVEKTGRGFWPYCVRAGDGTREVFVGHQKQCAVVAAELETAFEDGKFVSCIAPSPAGVDGLEVVGVRVTSDGFGSYIADSAMGMPATFPGEVREPLCRLSSASSIIIGLQEKIERLQFSLEVAKTDELSAAVYAETESIKHSLWDTEKERDQQAQRIGELEGLLRHAQKQVPTGSGLHMRIDAALSAVCAAAPNIATTSEHSGS